VKSNKNVTFYKENLVTFSTFLLLALSLFLPKLNSAASLNFFRLSTSIVLLVVVITVLIVLDPKVNRIFNSYTFWIAGLYPAYIILQSLLSDSFMLFSIGNSDRNLGGLTALGCLGFFVLGSHLGGGTSSKFYGIFLGLLVLQIMIICVLGFESLEKASQGNFMQSNSTSFMLVILLILTSGIFFETTIRSASQKLFISSLIVVSLVLLFLNQSLQGILGLLGVCLIWLLWRLGGRKVSLTKISLMSISLASIIFVTFVSLSPVPNANSANQNSFFERLEIYKTAIRIFESNLLFGLGVDRFNEGYYAFNLTNNSKLVDNAHSILLQIISTTGLVGFVFWVLPFIFVLLKHKKSDSPQNTPAVFAIVGYLIVGIIAIQVPGIEFLIFTLLGYLAFQKTSNEKVASLKPVGVGMLVTSSALILGVLLHISYKHYAVTNYLSGVTPKSVSTSDLQESLEDIHDLELLLLEGRFSMAVQDKPFGLLVLQRMTNLAPKDQRTIALAALLGNYWNDERLTKLTYQLDLEAKEQ
jgi:O-antigen ligase